MTTITSTWTTLLLLLTWGRRTTTFLQPVDTRSVFSLCASSDQISVKGKKYRGRAEGWSWVERRYRLEKARKYCRPLPLPWGHVFSLCRTHLPYSHRNGLLAYCSWSRTNHSTLPVAWEVTPEPGLVAAAAADTHSQDRWRMGGWVSEGRQKRVTLV